MMPGIEIRHRVRDGLVRGKLWRLTHDLGKLDGETSGAACYVCERPIPRGQVYAVTRATRTVVVHLECYLFWLHASGLFESEPVTCSSCRRLIPPHAETAVIEGKPYHRRCWERKDDEAGDASPASRR